VPGVLFFLLWRAWANYPGQHHRSRESGWYAVAARCVASAKCQVYPGIFAVRVFAIRNLQHETHLYAGNCNCNCLVCTQTGWSINHCRPAIQFNVLLVQKK
jgi:hypothetical protein